jgi:uncharacterized protein (DUF433 family)
MSKIIEIVDRGRGLQLSTSRITVQDLVPYFQRGESYEEIIRWIPILTHDEIAVVDRYYRAHQAELDEQDARIRARSAERKNPEWVEEISRKARAKRSAMLEDLRSAKANGEPL